jgi:hypothetical protein
MAIGALLSRDDQTVEGRMIPGGSARFHGLHTVAFDGLNSLKVPDTDRNRSWIERIRYRMGLLAVTALVGPEVGGPTLRHAGWL